MARIDDIDAEVAKLREEVLELRAAVTKYDDLSAEVAKLREEAKKPVLASSAKHAPKGKPVLPEEFKGTKSYRVGPSKHYRNGRVYREGEIVTVTDELPDADWSPVEVEAAPAASSAPAGEPSGTQGKVDRSI